MKSFTQSRAATIVPAAALTLMMSFGSSSFAQTFPQTDGSGTRFPTLQGPALQGPASIEGTIEQLDTAPPVFDALGNLVDLPNSETFGETFEENFAEAPGQANFEPIPEAIGPQLPNESFAEPFNQDQAFTQEQPLTQPAVTPENFDPRDQWAQPPVVVERARPLPPSENVYPGHNGFGPAGPTDRRAYSRAEIEYALQRLAIMEQLLKQQLLRQQLLRETASRYPAGTRYPSVSRYPTTARYPSGARYPSRPSCSGGSRGGYNRPYGRPGY